MWDEIRTIAGYPLGDRTAFVLLALFVWFFDLLGAIGGRSLAAGLTQGALLAYSFTALTRVAGGNLTERMADIGDVTALFEPLRLSFAALVVSGGPQLLWMVLHPEGSSAASALPFVLLVLAFAWKVVYSPVALTIAAISRSLLQTLNPLMGIGAIVRMGAVYWHAMAIYTAIVGAQYLLALLLGFVPVLGSLVKAFVDAYACLAIGCTLGLAVFKRAAVLGLDGRPEEVR